MSARPKRQATLTDIDFKSFDFFNSNQCKYKYIKNFNIEI